MRLDTGLGLGDIGEVVQEITPLPARDGWKNVAEPDRAAQSRQAGVRAKVEHPFLVVKRDFGFVKTRYRGIAKNLDHLQVLFASANWLMRAGAVALMGCRPGATCLKTAGRPGTADNQRFLKSFVLELT